MKITFNSGPYVDSRKFREISNGHSKELWNFLWGWYESLEEEVACHLEEIVVNPTEDTCARVSIKGIFSNRCGSPHEPLFWAGEFEVVIVNNFAKSIIATNESFDKEKVDKRLNDKFRRALASELTKYQASVDQIRPLLNLISE